MACFEGICGGADVPHFTEVVRASGLGAVALEQAPRTKLLGAEFMFAKGPLDFASFPALAFRLAHCNASRLKAALSVTLATHPMLAGRFAGDGEVALTNDGVPFTVCSDAAACAPEELEEKSLLHFADFRQSLRIRKGREPLMTVKLTRFRDGSAVLAMCRSHGLLDGTSAWAFLGDWAAAARGESLRDRAAADRAAMQGLLPSEEQLAELMVDLHGKKLTRSWMGLAFQHAMKPMSVVMDSLFLSGAAFPNRHCVFLSDQEVARIKAAATPAPGSGGDGWVSTQEALAAYILWAVAGATLPANSKGRALLVLLLDARTALGLPKSTCTGNCITLVGLQVRGILQMSLAEVAGALHENAKVEASPERLRKRWLLGAGLGEKDMAMEAMKYLMDLRSKSDIILQLNNQSKRVLPDFGNDASGGRAQAVMTNAGPTLILPAKGGLNVFLCPSFIGSSKSRRAQKALEALRSELPGPALSPKLLGRVGPAETEGEGAGSKLLATVTSKLGQGGVGAASAAAADGELGLGPRLFHSRRA